MPIDPAEVFALVKEGSAGRPHVAQAMVDRGYVKSVREAFDRYLSTERSGERAAQALHARRGRRRSSGARAACRCSLIPGSRTATS